MSDENNYDHYSVIMEWDPSDCIYIVTVPELPGCMTHGSNIEEAASQAKDAIESWIDAARAWGRSLPKPRYFDIASSSCIEHSPLETYQSEKVG